MAIYLENIIHIPYNFLEPFIPFTAVKAKNVGFSTANVLHEAKGERNPLKPVSSLTLVRIFIF